jgi:transcriptional regulator with XRE-family HTH domain
MKRKFRQPRWKGLLPKSGEILGALARLCDWQPEHSAKERTWRKFCHGEHLHGTTRRAILEEMAGSLVQKMGAGHDARGEPLSVETATQGMLHLILAHAIWWDLLCKRLESALPAKPTPFMLTVALRLVVVELAMRFSGLLLLHGRTLTVPSSIPPGRQADARRFLLPYVLREVLKEAGITRMALAEALNVTKEAVDQWLEAGAIIQTERLDAIVKVVSQKMGGNPTHLSLGLRVVRQMTLGLMPLADVIGEEELGRLIVGWVQLTGVTGTALKGHTEHLTDEARRELLGELITLGGESSLGVALRQAMREKAPDESWTRAIATPPGKWLEFLGDVAAVETVSSRTRHFLQERGFAPLERETEQLRQDLLLPRERPTNPFAPLLALPPEEGVRAYLVCLVDSFQKLAHREPDPEVLRTLGVHTEIFGLLAQLGKDEVKTIAEDYMWRCHGLFVLGCMRIGRAHLEKKNEPEVRLWAERLMKAIQALPPLPTKTEPWLEPRIIRFLQEMKRVQEDVEAGRMPKVDWQDFT